MKTLWIRHGKNAPLFLIVLIVLTTSVNSQILDRVKMKFNIRQYKAGIEQFEKGNYDSAYYYFKTFNDLCNNDFAYRRDYLKNYKQSCYKCKQYLDQVDSIIISRDTKNLDSLIFGHKCRIEYGAARSSVLGYLIDKDKLLNSLRIQTEDDQFKRIRISDIKSFEYIERDGYLKRKREADSILTIVNKESSSGNYNSAINVLEANKSKMERMGVDYILKYYSNLAQSNISTDDKESFLKITDNIGKYDRNLSYYWQLKY